jgi:transposase
MKKRIATLKKLTQGTLSNSQAATILNLSVRQIIRIKQKFLEQGANSLIHGLNGKVSNNQIPSELYEKAISIVKEQFNDFGPTLATEHLLIDYNLKVNRETLRQKMIDEKIWKNKRRRKQIHRYKRVPKFSYGEMVQYDGSYEHWLEDRGETGEICLLMAVDDAKSQIQLIFFTTDEGTKCTFKFWEEYLLKHGKPLNIYLDNFSTYKSSLIERRLDPNAKTQFGRAMETIGINVVFANSPQAKGRVERRFGNLQDRLIKEMRLSGISTIEEANHYANEVFIPWFNKRYGKIAKTTQDLHQELTSFERKELSSILSIHTNRVVQNDFTLKYEGKYYQLIESKQVGIFCKDIVTIENWIDGSTKIKKGRHNLEFKVLEKYPKFTKKLSRKILLPRSQEKIDQNHPFRKASYQRYLNKLALRKVTF